MANVATKAAASPHRLVYSVVGDGTVALIIDSAKILGDMVAGPLKNAWTTGAATQALMRTAFLYGTPISIRTQVQIQPVDTTAQKNAPAADVDTDAVTPTQAEINLEMSDTNGQTIILEIVYEHSMVA